LAVGRDRPRCAGVESITDASSAQPAGVSGQVAESGLEQPVLGSWPL